MKFRKRYIAAMLILCMVIPLGSALAVSEAGGLSALFSPGNKADSTATVSLLSHGAQEARVTWEIVTEGKTGEIEDDTENAVVRFTLENPGAETVSFNYTVLSGSAESGQHLKGDLSGSVTLSSDDPEMTISIGVNPLADNPKTYETANNPNALWTGERIFYIFCSDIQNALFDGGRQSLTVPVPIESEFDYEASYTAAVAVKLIDLDTVSGGTGGVFALTSGNPLTLTGTIDGDIRKMLDAGVFTHVLLPGGTLSNDTDTEQTVSYRALVYRNSEDVYGMDAFPPFPSIVVPANDELSFYSEDFTQSQPVFRLNLGPGAESNGMFSRLDFILEGDGVSARFVDEGGNYAPRQVCFSDEVAPTVKGVSTGSTVYYGDEAPVVITFSEPVYTDDITFKVNGESLRPMEKSGTISESVSFLYTVGDEALGVSSSLPVEVSGITGAKDLSGKVQEFAGTESGSLSIGDFDAERSLLYCAQPEATVDQGTSRTATVNVSVPLKADTALRTWLADGSRLDESVSKVFKARAITAGHPEGADIALTVEIDDSTGHATGLTGSFTAPENTTDAGAEYILEFYLDVNGTADFQLLRGLTAEYTIPPIILADEESDVTLTYTGWPASNSIFEDAAAGLSLGYTLNVDATWKQSTYFVWTSSNEAVATINQIGNITVLGAGTVSFTLTVSNPLNSDKVTLSTPTLTVVKAGDAYLYVPTALSKLDVLKGSDARVSFSTNLTARNEAALPGAETAYTFTLYSADDSGDTLQRGAQVWQDVLTATAAAPVTSCTVPAAYLQTATAKGVYGYILEIEAADAESSASLTAEAYIRVREKPAKAVLTRPSSLYLTDGAGSFSVTAGAESATADTDYRLTVTRNSESAPVVTAVAPGAVTVSVSAVDTGRLTDVYTVSLRVKNPDDPAWSADSFCVYVYRGGSMRFLVEGLPTGGSRVELKPNLAEGTVYDVGALRSRMSLGLSKTVRLDSSAGWSGAIDQITWSVSGESASLWYGQTRIRSGESLTLPPNASLQIVGDAAGTATVTATHVPTGMSVSNQVAVSGVDHLYLFQSAPKAHGRLVYTNGNGAEKDVPASHGSAGVYEPSGIASDVVFYPEASTLYDFAVLTKNALDAGQKKASAFDLYPVHTLRVSEVNHQLSLSLFDEATGAAYTGDITVRGGLYVNGEYYSHTKINGKRGDANQTATAGSLGQYTLSFDVRDYYAFAVKSPSPSDELRYVVEVSFGTDYFPLYVTVENADIQARKSSGLGVSVSAGIKKVAEDMIQNKAIVLSQSITLDGKELSLDDSLLKLDGFPSQALLNMTLLLPDYRDDYTAYYLHLEDGTGQSLGYRGLGEVEHPYPFSDIVTLRFSNDIRMSLYWMVLYHLETAEKGYIYPSVEMLSQASGTQSVYRLSKPIRVQSLVGVAAMRSWEILDGVSLVTLIESLTPSYNVPSLSTGNGLVDEALGIARGVSAYPYQKLIGLEISSTDDPLVYKGILRYAAGSEYFQDNSMHGGVYMREDDPASYSFLPSLRFTGEGKTAFMKRARSGNSTYYLSGGAYAECSLRYNLTSKEWDLSILKVDLDMRVSQEYERRYNTYIGPVPVTAKFTTELSAAAGLTVLHAADGTKTAYIPRLSPSFSIRGSGGVGRDYKVLALWAGPYGKAGMTQNYLWYRDSDGQTANGQRLSISGEVGVAFEIKLGPFWTIDGEYELTSYSKSWAYNDYNRITGLISGGVLPPGQLFASDTVGLVPVSQTISSVDRSYLDRFERAWGEPSGRMGLMGRGGESAGTMLETNANPDSAPRLSDDGGLLAYLSDMGSADLRDTAAVFSLRDGSGGYPASQEISASVYPDDALALSGTASGGASAVWLRYFTDESGGTGDEATAENVINALASAEVMAAIYDPEDETFTTTQLTDNTTPETSPVTAFAGGKAIAAWISAVPGDMEDLSDMTSNQLVYAFHNGSNWTEAKVLYDGSLAPATALSAAMMDDGTSAILYQVAGEAGDSDIFCDVLDASGTVLRTLLLTDSDTEDFNPQLVAVQFSDGTFRFVAGWNQVDENGRLSIRLSAVNADGTPYPTLSLALSDEGGPRDYDGFLLSKGAQTLEQLSVLWGEAEDADGDGVYKYAVYGAKPVELPGGGFSLSGGARLLELSEETALRSLDARTVSDTELQLVMVTQEPSGEATMSAVTATYQAAVSVAEPRFLYADLVPGLELPVSFTVKNDGMEPITKILLTLGVSTFAYEDLNLLPGSSETFTVLYPVPETVADADYTVIATFGSADVTATATGTLKLNLPDVGIAQIDVTKQIGRERGFRVLLENSGHAPLSPLTHSVRLEVWDDPNFDELDSGKEPLWSKLILGADITSLSGSPLPVNVTLDAAALAPLLIDGEVPDGGAWVYFRVVLLENGTDTQDAESGNDLDYVQIYSLIEQYGKKVSLSSALDIESGGATLQVNAANNSMQAITNGGIVATLRDEAGNALETQRTTSPLNIAGESSGTADLTFTATGHSADVTFVTTATGGARLSALNLTGVPLNFDPDVQDYTVQTYDLTNVILTAVAEDPAAALTVKRNGTEISAAGPLSLPYGETVFTVTVTASGGAAQATYTVRIQNSSTQNTPDPVGPGSESQSAELKIGGVSRSGLRVRISGGQASVALGELAREIFDGSAGATLTIPAISGLDRYLLELPADALSGEDSGASLTFDMPIAQISLPAGMLGGMTDLAGKTAGITIAKADETALSDMARAAVGNRPLLSLTLTLDGVQTDWSNPNTPVTVSIPYVPTAEERESPESIIIWYIDGSGSLQCVTNGRYKPETGTVTFEITHFSLYAVGYNPVEFADVSPAAWYAEAVSYLAARGITSGTTATTFSPDSTLTRGQFITLLLRAYDIDSEADGSDNFADAGNTYYTGYLAAAKHLGISNGVGDNNFAPEAAITRQDMFTLLYNALNVLDKLPDGDSGKTLSDFPDSGAVAAYAREAMAYLVEAGTVGGSDGYLLPEATSTRAQMAQVLYNLLRQ